MDGSSAERLRVAVVRWRDRDDWLLWGEYGPEGRSEVGGCAGDGDAVAMEEVSTRVSC